LLGLLAAWGALLGQTAPELDRLAGTWEVLELIDDGKAIPQAEIRRTLIQDGRLQIKGNIISFIRPGRSERRELPFVVNASVSPRALDIAGAEKTGSKGIYSLDGETLIICLAGEEKTTRPSTFTSSPGSSRLLMTLTRAKSPPTQPLPAPPVAAPSRNQDDDFRKTLVGTWGHQDDKRVEMITLNPDGTFSKTLTWKKGFQKVFGDDTRSSGTWKVESGLILVRITASTQRELVNQIYSYRIYSLSPSEVHYIDQAGSLRREWKTR
jgi:uncharacterized protein (TIGR03067 family)